MAKRSSTSTTKEKVAKDKVNNLLKDVLPKKEKEVDVLEKKVANKSTDWLTEEIDKLTAENEQLKGDLEKAMKEIHALKNDPNAPVDTDQIKNGVKKLFKDLEANYIGANQTRTRYLKADIKILLDKFLATFPFLMKK
jgi:hypothetical protein